MNEYIVSVILIGFFIEDYDFVVIGGGFGGLVCVKVGMDSSIKIYIFFFYVLYEYVII